MRHFLIFLLCLLSVSSFGQGVAIRSLSGQGTNLALKGSGALPALTVDTNTLVVSTNKRVGIGTNAPTAALHIGSGGSIESTHKRVAGAASHAYEALRFDYGDPSTNAYWSWIVGSVTNSNDAAGSFDHYLTWGFNMSSSPNYRTNLPTIGYGMEHHYVTGAQVPQAEHYMNFGVNYTNFHERPWGWAFNETYPPTVLHTWNVDQFEFNAVDAVPSLQIVADPNQTNKVTMILPRASSISFTGNTNYVDNGGAPGGRMFIQESGVMLLGKDTNGFTALSGPQLGATNQISLFPTFGAGVYSLNLNFGAAPNIGLRWSHLNSRMEVNNGSGWTAVNSGTFLSGISVSGGPSNLFQSQIRMRTADLVLEQANTLVFGTPFAVATDKSQYIKGESAQEVLSLGSWKAINFFTGTSTSGGGTERGGFTNDVFYVNHRVNCRTNIGAMGLKTNFITFNTKYTNDATLLGSRRSLLWVNVAVTNTTPVTLCVDQDADGTYEENYNTVVSDSVGVTNILHISDMLQPGAFFVITNVGPGTMGVFSSKLTGL